MAKLNNKDYSKQDILRYCGSVDQIASITQSQLNGGKANGLQSYNVKTGGGLEYNVLPSKCLDISSLSYKGVNISFLTKNGLTGPSYNVPIGDEFVNYMIGGMLFTCGLRNVGGSCEDNKDFHPLHGRIGITPAQYAYANCYWEKDDYIMEMGGVVKETALFGVNMSLTRKIISKLGENEIEIRDVIENNSSEEQEFMFLYHINFGFPFLDNNLKILFPENILTPLNEVAKAALNDSVQITKPIDGFEEHVFFRDVKEEDGIVTIRLLNDNLGIGAYIKYEKENLPNLTQWKAMKSGDYALSIEPCNCFVKGVKEERENGTLKTIPAFSTLRFNLKIGFFDLN